MAEKHCFYLLLHESAVELLLDIGLTCLSFNCQRDRSRQREKNQIHLVPYLLLHKSVVELLLDVGSHGLQLHPLVG